MREIKSQMQAPFLKVLSVYLENEIYLALTFSKRSDKRRTDLAFDIYWGAKYNLIWMIRANLESRIEAARFHKREI